MKPKQNPQSDCVSFEAAIEKFNCLNQPGLLVKYMKMVVVSPGNDRLTMTFDPVKFAKEKARKSQP